MVLGDLAFRSLSALVWLSSVGRFQCPGASQLRCGLSSVDVTGPVRSPLPSDAALWLLTLRHHFLSRLCVGQAGCLLPLPVFPDCLGRAPSHRLPAPLGPSASQCPTSAPLFSLPLVLRGPPSQATETPPSPRDMILYHRTNCVHLIENHTKFDRVPSYRPPTEFCRKQIRNHSVAAFCGPALQT